MLAQKASAVIYIFSHQLPIIIIQNNNNQPKNIYIYIYGVVCTHTYNNKDHPECYCFRAQLQLLHVSVKIFNEKRKIFMVSINLVVITCGELCCCFWFPFPPLLALLSSEKSRIKQKISTHTFMHTQVKKECEGW